MLIFEVKSTSTATYNRAIGQAVLISIVTSIFMSKLHSVYLGRLRLLLYQITTISVFSLIAKIAQVYLITGICNDDKRICVSRGG